MDEILELFNDIENPLDLMNTFNYLTKLIEITRKSSSSYDAKGYKFSNLWYGIVNNKVYFNETMKIITKKLDNYEIFDEVSTKEELLETQEFKDFVYDEIKETFLISDFMLNENTKELDKKFREKVNNSIIEYAINKGLITENILQKKVKELKLKREQEQNNNYVKKSKKEQIKENILKKLKMKEDTIKPSKKYGRKDVINSIKTTLGIDITPYIVNKDIKPRSFIFVDITNIDKNTLRDIIRVGWEYKIFTVEDSGINTIAINFKNPDFKHYIGVNYHNDII